jgi:membrane protease subunit HflK
MRRRFDEHGNPDFRGKVAEYGDAMRKRLRWLAPLGVGLVLAILAWSGSYSVDPGEVGVVRTFGRLSGKSEPGLHFALPIVQQVDVVDLVKIRRIEIGFRSEADGSTKIVPAEAQMLTGDENIVEGQMIVQYQVADPEKYLFRIRDAEATLRVAAEVALRSVVGTMRITSSIEELAPPEEVQQLSDAQAEAEAAVGEAEEADAGAPPAPSAKPPDKPKAPEKSKAPEKPAAPAIKKPPAEGEPDPSTDILTKGRERAEVETKKYLAELMDLYESGLRITEVKLLPVDVPDEVKDAFHDVVRAREEREQLINMALGPDPQGARRGSEDLARRGSLQARARAPGARRRDRLQLRVRGVREGQRRDARSPSPRSDGAHPRQRQPQSVHRR